MASGIGVSDKCVAAYNALSKRASSIVVLKINSSMTDVEVEKTIPPSGGDFEAEWKRFYKTLPDDECRYVIADFQWNDTPTVTKSKVISLVRCRLGFCTFRVVQFFLWRFFLTWTTFRFVSVALTVPMRLVR
jgi:Cofilin/tropomyosin-type actin-binding protein